MGAEDSLPNDGTRLLPRAAFIGLEPPLAHLAAGGETPPLKATGQAIADFLEQKSLGMAGRDEFTARYASVKRRFAEFVSLPGEAADRVAFIGSAAEGINRFAESIQWRPGDEVVSIADEYPNALTPWLSRARDGVRLVTVEPGEDTELAVEAAINKKTRVICVSHVSYLNGRRLSLEKLRQIADGCGAFLVVDASQSLGALPVDARLCDVLVSCCYKFILGIHGLGVFYANERVLQQLSSRLVGWHSIVWPSLTDRSVRYQLKPGAGWLELGNPPFVSVVALDEGMKALDAIPKARLEAHIMRLGRQLRTGLANLGVTVWGPEDESRMSANIVFGCANSAEVVDALAAHDVLAWSGDDRVRLSLHAYNDEADVSKALEVLAGLGTLQDADMPSPAPHSRVR
jgi:selenocysteine lyase/cysteine desulfurase